MSNTLWICICFVMGGLVAIVCEFLASSIHNKKEDLNKNEKVSVRLFIYGWVIIFASLMISLRCISIIDQQNKEKIEQLTEQIDSLKTLHGSELDTKICKD